MSVLSFPEGLIPNTIEFSLQTNTQSFTSELTQVTQTNVLPGDRWSCNMTFSNRVGAEARKLQALLVSLRGTSGRVYVTPFDHRTPSGVASGTPLVKGANQTGNTLTIDGCIPSITGWLLAGDYFQVGNELKMITADCNTNGSGETTLTFEPALKLSPADNASIITNNPTCIMKLSDNNQARWSGQPHSADSKIYAMTIAMIEAIDI